MTTELEFDAFELEFETADKIKNLTGCPNQVFTLKIKKSYLNAFNPGK